jgi:hypothetical protein
MKTIRTKKDGVYGLTINSLHGAYWRKVNDPDGVETPDFIDNFELLPDYPRLPRKLFGAIVNFFNHFEKLNREVQVLLYRNDEDLSEWRVMVPKQENTIASVKADLTMQVDLITEEVVDDLPENWLFAGTMHLHPGNLGAFWSATDDESELKNPGLHCTIGHLGRKVLDICVSVTMNGNRYTFSPIAVIDGAQILNKSEKTHSYTLQNSYSDCKQKFGEIFSEIVTAFVSPAIAKSKLAPYQYQNKWWENNNWSTYLPEYKKKTLKEKFYDLLDDESRMSDPVTFFNDLQDLKEIIDEYEDIAVELTKF